MSKEFDISQLFEITQKDKYAATVAAFEVIDILDQVEIPKKLSNRKPAIKAMSALSENLVKWDYIAEEDRLALEEEIRAAKKPSHTSLDAVFTTAGSAAPVAEEDEEDLDEEVETAPPEEYEEDSEGGFASDFEEEEDEEEEDEEEDEPEEPEADDLDSDDEEEIQEDDED